MIVWLCILKWIIRRIARCMGMMFRAVELMPSTHASIGGTSGFSTEADMPTLNGASVMLKRWRNCRFIIDDMDKEFYEYTIWSSAEQCAKALSLGAKVKTVSVESGSVEDIQHSLDVGENELFELISKENGIVLFNDVYRKIMNG